MLWTSTPAGGRYSCASVLVLSHHAGQANLLKVQVCSCAGSASPALTLPLPGLPEMSHTQIWASSDPDSRWPLWKGDHANPYPSVACPCSDAKVLTCWHQAITQTS
jgi:hypothetical protein